MNKYVSERRVQDEIECTLSARSSRIWGVRPLDRPLDFLTSLSSFDKSCSARTVLVLLQNLDDV